MKLGDHTITVRRADPVLDRYGNPTGERSWDDATETPVEGCSFQPGTSTEYTNQRQTVVNQSQVFMPFETDVVSTDRIVYAGETYDVDGGIQTWDFPPLGHKLARLTRTTEG